MSGESITRSQSIPDSSNYDNNNASIEDSKKNEVANVNDDDLKLPRFDQSIINPTTVDVFNIKNYTNVTWKDKLAAFNYLYLDGECPLFIKKAMLTINRKVFVQTPLPDYLTATKKDGTIIPKQIYPRNKIRTTKYTPINFIPKNLFFQFKNAANGYFLFVAILGAFQIFGVSSPGMNAVPLIVIVVLTAIRDAFEDSRRAISDNELNNSRIHLVTGLDNPNVSVGEVGPWRKFKKWNSKLFKKLLTFFVNLFSKKNAKNAKDVEKGNELQSIISQQETLNTIEGSVTNASYYNNRLSIQTTRYLNAVDKISKPIPETISDPSIQPTGEIKFKNKCWKDIYVGDIVRVRQNEEIPADLVLLSTSHDDDNCYIETKNLDGETNLKSKNALKAGNGLKYGNDIERIKCWVECDSPNPNLYSFKGVMHYNDYFNDPSKELLESVTIDNVVFRGSTLRNTKWAIGIVLYTGDETKIMLNSGVTPSKKSRISQDLNLSVYINFGLLFVLCLVSGIINGVFYNKKHVSRLYYEFAPYSDKSSVSGVVAFFVALILYQSLVPISLYISVEIIKTVQAFFIWSDIKMYYEPLDYPCSPKSWNISDDVGQVEYIFSDKTGTLTQNKMEFKKCSIGLRSYGMCYTEAKMGMQKRMGIDVIKEKIKMDKIVQDDKIDMLDILLKNKKFFTNGNDQTFISDINGEEDDVTTFISSDYLKDVLSNGPLKVENEWFMTALALCHTAVTEDDPNHDHIKIIKAESPDENALVGVARDVGIEFRAKNKDTMFVNRYGIEYSYRILKVIPFNSTRKRMSVIVEVPKSQLPDYHNEKFDDDETAIVLLSKGADNIIYERLRSDSDVELLQKTALYLEQFSKEGLRTLCVAYRIVDNKFYNEWSQEYHDATVSIADDREERIDNAANKIERDLTLIGTTAIEDRLQEGVPDSIALLGQAGIKLWVLTGDKIETAINIGFSCNLLGADMKLLVLDTSDSSNNSSQGSSIYEGGNNLFDIVESKLDKYMGEFNMIVGNDEELDSAVSSARQDHSSPVGTHAVIVDGASLNLIFDETRPDLKKKFLLLCKNCKSVLCCRVSPAQKAQVVKATKELFNVMTLAIGDGANDVAMIQAANIGVGIAGEEGRQAVMSSDYGLGQFKYLTRLVLVHGRWSYKRLSEMIPCFFYKNVVFTLTLFWYGIFVDFDGTYLFEFTLIMFYNLAFTSLPIIFLAILDQDVSDTVSLLTPELYRSGILGLEWSQFKFVYYMLDGIYQSVLTFFFPYLIYYNGNFAGADGHPLNHRFWMGTMVAIIGVISCNIYVLLQQKRWDWLSGIIYAFSILIIFFWVGVWSSDTYSGEYYKAAPQVFGSASFWAVFFVGVLCNLLPRFSFDTIRRLYRPKDVDIIRERVKMGDYDHYHEGFDPTDAKDQEIIRSIQEHKKFQENSKNDSDISKTSGSNENINHEIHTFPNSLNYPPTQAHDVIAETGIPRTSSGQVDDIKRQPTVKRFVKNPIGSIKRKLTISKHKNEQSHLSPIERLRQNMIQNGEYVGSRTSLTTHDLPGLSQAESLMSVHTRNSTQLQR